MHRYKLPPINPLTPNCHHHPLSTMFVRSSLFSSTTTVSKLFNAFIGPIPRLGIRATLTSPAAHSFDPAFNLDRGGEEYADIDWDGLGFNPVPTDYMYIMKCRRGEGFSEGELRQYGKIELSPSSGVLNYGQGIFEGLKAYRNVDGHGISLFRPVENALRMQLGAKRMCMPSPSVDQFLRSVKETVLANKRWVPPHGKGALYLRPLLIGSGSVLGVAPSPEYMLLVYATPVGTYFKAGFAPITLVVENEIARATPGGTGDVKAIGNYGPVLKAQAEAKAKGYTEVLYLDSMNKKYLEEMSASNIFVVKGNTILTPDTCGTILSGITRKSIISIARDYGYQVEERLISIDELIDADEVFCTGTAVVIAPVGSVTYHGQSYEYKTTGERVFQKLYTALTDIQMGIVEEKKGWMMKVQ